MGILK